MRLRHTTIILVMAYLWPGLGMARENMIILDQLSTLLRKFKLPFIFGADWNVTPQELCNTGWVEKHDLVVVPPHGFDHTCVTGRMLD